MRSSENAFISILIHDPIDAYGTMLSWWKATQILIHFRASLLDHISVGCWWGTGIHSGAFRSTDITSGITSKQIEFRFNSTKDLLPILSYPRFVLPSKFQSDFSILCPDESFSAGIHVQNSATSRRRLLVSWSTVSPYLVPIFCIFDQLSCLDQRPTSTD